MSKKLMIEEGKIMIGYSSTKGSPYFWRIVFCNPYVTEEQVLESMKMLEEYCEESYKLVIPNFTKE